MSTAPAHGERDRRLRVPDLLTTGLGVVICGTSDATSASGTGHYYAGRTDELWTYLHESGLLPEPLDAFDDERALEHGIGFADLLRDGGARSSDVVVGLHYDVTGFIARMAAYEPRWIALHGSGTAKLLMSSVGGPEPALGPQTWTIGESRIFVLPDASGANRDPRRWGGKASRLEWFTDLAGLLGTSG